LVGALALGAGAEVQAVAVATAVISVIALAVVEGNRRRWVGASTGRVATVVLCLLCGLVAALFWPLLDQREQRDPYVISSTSVDAGIKPPVLGAGQQAKKPKPSSGPSKRSRTPSQTPSATTTTQDPAKVSSPTPKPPLTQRLFRAMLALLLLALVLLLLRRVWVLLAWRLLRRDLRRGGSDMAVQGAWVWARRRLALGGVVLPPQLSPEQVIPGDAVHDVPRRVSRPLEALAGLVTLSAFSGLAPATRTQVTEAWQLADLASDGALRSIGPRRRVASWFRGPSRQRSR